MSYTLTLSRCSCCKDVILDVTNEEKGTTDEVHADGVLQALLEFLILCNDKWTLMVNGDMITISSDDRTYIGPLDEWKSILTLIREEYLKAKAVDCH